MSLRKLAAEILTQVIGHGQSLTAALAEHLPKLKEQQDKAFVQAACYGVIRHYFELDFILAKLLTKPLKAKDIDIKILLLLGIYQLQFMRVKEHAAVSETVAACKHKIWAKSLVNAILRQYLRVSEPLQQAVASNNQAFYNHPVWLIERLQQDWPDDYQQILVANNAAPPMTLRVNLRQESVESYQQLLIANNIASIKSPFCHTALILEQALTIDQLPEFQDGKVSVQDLAAQLAVEILAVQPGQRVLDLCAAPGGKTAAILEQHADLKSMLAIDIDQIRLKKVSDNLQRLQLTAELLAVDAVQTELWANGRQFERILLDAPCTGLGVIRRHPDIKLLRRPTDIDTLIDLQAQILEAAWSLLLVGGRLLYATCSILKAENEQQIARFLQRHDNVQEIPINANWGKLRECGRQILTGEANMDGFYYALLTKTA